MGVAAILAQEEWGECLVPVGAVPRELAAEVRQRMGAVPGWLSRMAACPWLVRAEVEIVRRPIAEVPPLLCDLVTLVVSQDNSCRYCYGIQRTILRIHGHSDERIDRLVRDFHVAPLTTAERAALEFARRLSRANPRPGRDALGQLMEAGFTRLAAVEIAVVAALSNFSNRMATLLSLPQEPLERFARHPLFRVVRPLLAWRMRPRPSPRQPLPEPNRGPFARLVAALDGSPTAAVFRRILDDAWASPILPARTKALMVAVIARALGCTYGEAEARALLAREGLEATDVDEILATLGSRRLDAREARLVPFARETLRYQPPAIQARMRDICRELTPAETLEMVGIVALANALCRLSVVLDAA
jgi:uncharacterized peroxidase-related enzyme